MTKNQNALATCAIVFVGAQHAAPHFAVTCK
jgi:hypothetical protein